MRVERGLTQAELAAVSGVDQPNISAIETGARSPTAETLHRLVFSCGFELTATAGNRVIACPPPSTGTVLDSMFDQHAPDESPTVVASTPMAERVQTITAVLELADLLARRR